MADIELTAEPAADIGFGETGDFEGLLPALIPGNKLDLGFANGEPAGDELDDGRVGCAFDRRSGDLDTEDVIAPPGYLVTGASRGDMQPKYDIGHLRYHLIKRSWALSILSHDR